MSYCCWSSVSFSNLLIVFCQLFQLHLILSGLCLFTLFLGANESCVGALMSCSFLPNSPSSCILRFFSISLHFLTCSCSRLPRCHATPLQPYLLISELSPQFMTTCSSRGTFQRGALMGPCDNLRGGTTKLKAKVTNFIKYKGWAFTNGVI